MKLVTGNRHPGGGYHYVICALCGSKKRAKDCILVNEKYNRLNNLLVCKEDYTPVHPQDIPKVVKERQISNPKLIRDEQADTFSTVTGGRTASAPRELSVIGASDSFVELEWLGPLDPGSSSASGYKIERESPVGGGFSTLVTTSSPAQYYKDTTVSSGTQYNYRVSIVNDAGIGATSNEASITTNS